MREPPICFQVVVEEEAATSIVVELLLWLPPSCCLPCKPCPCPCSFFLTISSIWTSSSIVTITACCPWLPSTTFSWTFRCPSIRIASTTSWGDDFFFLFLIKQQTTAATKATKKRQEPKEMKTITMIAVWPSGDGGGGNGDGLKGEGGGMRARLELFSAAIFSVNKTLILS